MGLDVLLWVENREELFPKDYDDPEHDHFHKHSLSRTFCNFMCRQHSSAGEPELDQIGRITSVDIQPIYDMEGYGSESGEELEFYLETAKDDQERQKILDAAKQAREKCRGNIDTLLQTINALIDKLSQINNLPGLLNAYGCDPLGYDDYFTDFNTDKGKGYIGNNFGQDLRNFKRFLEYAKDKGATTVYFQYG